MIRNPSVRSVLAAGIFIAAASISACGGSQAPAESPEAAPPPAEGESSPGTSGAEDAAGDGQHTMPDGTKMEGEHHPPGESPAGGSDDHDKHH